MLFKLHVRLTVHVCLLVQYNNDVITFSTKKPKMTFHRRVYTAYGVKQNVRRYFTKWRSKINIEAVPIRQIHNFQRLMSHAFLLMVFVFFSGVNGTKMAYLRPPHTNTSILRH